MNAIAAQIEAATGVADLRPAAVAIEQMVVRLQKDGIAVEQIAARVSGLNQRLFARLWGLLAPPDLVAASCLLVMGSEGRGEQLLRTDQDNALVLRNDTGPAGADVAAARFNTALADFGDPPCPGGVIVTNPLWRQPVAGFREAIRGWLMGGDPEGPMRLAIFCDAAPVAGDESLLAELRDFLDVLAADNDAYLARFAAAADQFHEPGHWWSWLTGHRDEHALDLKKLGIFPIVHGVRTLALQHHVRELGTAARLARLAELRRIDAGFARELLGALHFLMAIRLAHQLRQREAGLMPGNEVRPSDLELTERVPLRDALSVVKRFRTWLRQHFRFDTL